MEYGFSPLILGKLILGFLEIIIQSCQIYQSEVVSIISASEHQGSPAQKSEAHLVKSKAENFCPSGRGRKILGVNNGDDRGLKNTLQPYIDWQTATWKSEIE